ncbi:MFS transporter [Nonomuraea sp. NPDC050663]|uniref:MFS transporter n=1 Tax=Nonomuraea sp. NPDC050663 TaxID=3364370 RepID=UPI00379A1391
MTKAMAPLLIAAIVLFSAQQLLTPVLAPLSRALRLTETQLGLVVTVAAAALTVASPLWGHALRVIGLRAVLVIGLGLSTAGLAGFAAVSAAGLDGALEPGTTFVLMLVARSLVFGVGLAAVPVAALAVAGTVPEADRTRATGLVGASQGLSLIVGPAGGGALAVISLMVPLYVAPVLSALLLIWVLATVRPARPPRVDGPRPAGVRPWQANMWPLLATGFFLYLSLGLIQVVVGFLVADRLGLDAQQTAGAVGIVLVTAGVVLVGVQAAVVPALGWPALRLMRAGAPVALLSFVVLYIAHDLWLIAVAFGLLGLGLGLAVPGFTAAPSLVVGPDQQGSVSGLVNATVGATFIAGPALGTFLYELSPEATIVGSLLSAVIALGLVWLSPAARHLRRPVIS